MSPFHDGDRDTSGLTDEAKSLLDFEREWWRYAGDKQGAIKEHFGCSPTTYYRFLNEIIDDDRSLVYDAMLVKRLRRMRVARQRQRADARASGAH